MLEILQQVHDLRQGCLHMLHAVFQLDHLWLIALCANGTHSHLDLARVELELLLVRLPHCHLLGMWGGYLLLGHGLGLGGQVGGR